MLTAIDIFPMIPQVSPNQMSQDLSGIQRGAFATVCLAESFESVCEEHLEDLADALCVTAKRYYEQIQQDIDEGGMLLSFPGIGACFQRYENVFFVMNEFAKEIAPDHWRAIIAWRNVQDNYTAMKKVLVAKSIYKH